jgi:hypothetical protein
MPKFRYLSLPAFTALLALGVSSPNVQAQAPLYTLAKSVLLGGVMAR